MLGGFGGLFGSGAQPALDVARATGVGAPAAIVASPTAAQRLAALQRAGSPNSGVRAHRRNAHRHAFRPHSAPHRSPTGRPQPSLPPTPPPPPQKGQTVSKAGDTAKQVTSQAPPQLHDQAVHAAGVAFTDAFNDILLIGALILFSGALAVLALVRQGDFVPHGAPEGAAAPEEAQEPVAA